MPFAGVLALFSFAGYRRRMPEPDDDLTPARAEDLRASIAFALTSDGRLAKTQSAELMASIVAERLIARLERDGFVIMQRPRRQALHLRAVRGSRAPNPFRSQRLIAQAAESRDGKSGQSDYQHP